MNFLWIISMMITITKNKEKNAIESKRYSNGIGGYDGWKNDFWNSNVCEEPMRTIISTTNDISTNMAVTYLKRRTLVMSRLKIRQNQLIFFVFGVIKWLTSSMPLINFNENIAKITTIAVDVIIAKKISNASNTPSPAKSNLCYFHIKPYFE